MDVADELIQSVTILNHLACMGDTLTFQVEGSSKVHLKCSQPQLFAATSAHSSDKISYCIYCIKFTGAKTFLPGKIGFHSSTCTILSITDELCHCFMLASRLLIKTTEASGLGQVVFVICFLNSVSLLVLIPFNVGFIDRVHQSKQQRRATRMMSDMKGLPFEERLKRPGLFSLEERYLQGEHKVFTKY